MKAAKINSSNKEVKIIDYKPKKHDITLLQSLIGCSAFGGVGYTYDDQGGTIFYDDNGLYKTPVTWFYIPDLYPMPIAGNCVILGVDVASGESISIPKALSDDLLSGACHVGFPNSDKVVQIERDIMNASAVKSKEAPLW